jgi:FKBP-type peptidyl-prolyl cis-trans isomerase SlyD
MQIVDHTVVSIDYTLSNEAGEVLESSDESEPLSYIHGLGQIVPGLENALAGRTVGDSLTVNVSAEDGYGAHDPDLVHRAQRTQFGDATPEVGMRFQADGPDGPLVLTVVDVEGDTITLDGNHPLAGVPLTFAVTVRSVRAATKQEIEHGHAHGDHGHDH